MNLPFDPTTLADILEPALGERPVVTASGRNLVVSKPFPVKLIVAPTSNPSAFAIACPFDMGPTPHGAACMAANAFNLDSASGVLARVEQVDGDLHVVVETLVHGPIHATSEFATALKLVVEGTAELLAGIGQAVDLLAAAQRLGGVGAVSAPAEAAAASPSAPVAQVQSSIAALSAGYV